MTTCTNLISHIINLKNFQCRQSILLLKMESMSTLQSEFSMGFDTLFVVLMLINIKDANYFFWTSSFQECFWGDAQPRQNIVIRVHAHLGWVLCFIFEGDPPNRIPSSRKMCCWSLHVYATEFKPTFISWNFGWKSQKFFLPQESCLILIDSGYKFEPEINIYFICCLELIL